MCYIGCDYSDMLHFFILLLVLAAHIFHFALGQIPIEERAALGQGPVEERGEAPTTDEVLLSLFPPFEPWPGFFEGRVSFSSRSVSIRSLQKRGPESLAVCRRIEVPEFRRHLGYYKHFEAWCDATDPVKKKFRVTCKQRGDIWLNTLMVAARPGECEDDTMCLQFRGNSEFDGSPASDINCVKRATIRQWVVDTTKATIREICSAFYRNDVKDKLPVKMALQTNVLDSKQLEFISPANVFYKLDGNKIGGSRAHDAIVGSGIVEVPPGSALQACVEAVPGQILWAVVGLTALLIDTGQGGSGN